MRLPVGPGNRRCNTNSMAVLRVHFHHESTPAQQLAIRNTEVPDLLVGTRPYARYFTGLSHIPVTKSRSLLQWCFESFSPMNGSGPDFELPCLGDQFQPTSCFAPESGLSHSPVLSIDASQRISQSPARTEPE